MDASAFYFQMLDKDICVGKYPKVANWFVPLVRSGFRKTQLRRIVSVPACKDIKQKQSSEIIAFNWHCSIYFSSWNDALIINVISHSLPVRSVLSWSGSYSAVHVHLKEVDKTVCSKFQVARLWWIKHWML